jgi:hypothetical protein
MIAEGLKVVCVQHVDEGHIVESALGRPDRRPNPRPLRDFGNSVDHENLYDLSKAYFAVTFLRNVRAGNSLLMPPNCRRVANPKA